MVMDGDYYHRPDQMLPPPQMIEDPWTTSSHHWMPDSSVIRDVKRSAQMAADSSGRPQLIHPHRQDDPCHLDDGEHIIIDPDDRRRHALGGDRGKATLPRRTR